MHGLIKSSSSLPDYYQVCSACFQCSVDSVGKRRGEQCPYTHQNTPAILGCVLGFKQDFYRVLHTFRRCQLQQGFTDSEKPCAKVWRHRFRTKFICHMGKIIFWLTLGATTFHMSHHIQNEVQISQTFLSLRILGGKKALVELRPFSKVKHRECG